ncbi:MAG: PorT family protein [Prevotella sp.]|nr:PorT family protein [Prevotella sp.]
MKRLSHIILGLLLAVDINAQSLWDSSKPDYNLTFKVLAGINASSTDGVEASAVRTGYHIDGMVDYNIIKSVSICSGLSFTTKGFKSIRGEAEMTYLQIPLLASYRLETPTGVQFHFNVGMYFAYGIGGKIDFSPLDINILYSFDQKSFGENGFFTHFDTGLSAGAYILLGHLQLGVSYEYGFRDIAKVYDKFHNRNVCLSAGYVF